MTSPHLDVWMFLPSGSVSRAGRWVNSMVVPAPGTIHALAGGGPSRTCHDSLRHSPLHGQFLALGHGNILVRVCFWGWVPGATSSSHRTSVSGFIVGSVTSRRPKQLQRVCALLNRKRNTPIALQTALQQCVWCCFLHTLANFLVFDPLMVKISHCHLCSSIAINLMISLLFQVSFCVFWENYRAVFVMKSAPFGFSLFEVS